MSRQRDRAKILDQLIVRHADSVVTDRQHAVLSSGSDPDTQLVVVPAGLPRVSETCLHLSICVHALENEFANRTTVLI